MLTEHAETVHTKFIDQEKNFWYILGNSLLKLCDNFEDVVISKDGIHSNDNFPHDYKDVSLNLNIDSLKQLLIANSDRLESVYNDIKNYVVHAL